MIDLSHSGFLLGWKISRIFVLVKIRLFRVGLFWIKRRLHIQVNTVLSKDRLSRDKIKQIVGDFSNYAAYLNQSESTVIIKAADSFLEGFYNILGSGPVKLSPINWHVDFKSGKIWSKGKFYKDYIQVDLSDDSDVKVPRELSRAHHLLILGQAYLLTKDEKYALEVVNQLDNWIDENPLMYSINWGCAMDVAIRSVNFLYSLTMIIESKSLTDCIYQKVIISLFEHGYYIFNNLEKSFKNSNNHYMSDLAGLIFLSLLFRETKEGTKWEVYSINEYFTEIRYQVLPSGVTYEMSISYHRLTTELIFYTYLFLKQNNVYIPPDIRHRIRSLFEFMMYYIKPNGFVPVIGDQDDGRFLPFSITHNLDHRYLLTIASAEFEDPGFRQHSFGGLAEVFFLLKGKTSILAQEISQNKQQLLSRLFEDAGFCIMRGSDIYVFISNSGSATYPDQIKQWGSHSHADLLSFELNYKSIDFIVDPGTYSYSGNPQLRNLLRSAAMHNTLVVDGRNQQEYPPGDIFRCTSVAKPLISKFTGTDEIDIFTGSHDAYLTLPDPVSHTRSFELHKPLSTLTITDVITCADEHEYTLYLHLDSGVEVVIDQEKAKLCKEGICIILKFDIPFEFTVEKKEQIVSKAYGEKSESTTIECSFKQKGGFKYSIRISPVQIV